MGSLTGYREVSDPRTATNKGDTPSIGNHLDHYLDHSDVVEDALASALTKAAAAGRFDVVAQLAKQIEARRLTRAKDVIALDTGRRDKNGRP